MKSHVFSFALLSAMAIVASAPAQAQNGPLTRSFVSSTGVDTNACTISEPCATFAQAYTKVGADGIIAALDPGKYGPLTNITTGVTVNGNGWAAITGPSGGTAVTINASSGNVTLTGLEIDGAGTSSNGIVFISGGSLNVRNTVIQNFSNAGIDYGPNVSSHLFMSNTLVSDNGNYGIYIANSTNAGTVDAVFDNVTMENNNVGLGGTFAALWLQNSATAMIRNSTIASNNLGIGANNGSIIRITRSTITGNTTGWSGQVLSYNDNNIDGNTNGDTAPPCVNGTSPCSAYK